MQLINLKTDFLGKNTIYYKEIDSTQNEIYRLIKNNSIKNGTLVMADIQTNGKGTHGRVWHTDEEDNIAFSFYVNVNCNIQNVEGLTIEIAQIIIEIFENKYGIELEVKEPNDIMYNNKKLGGILTQTKLLGETVKYLVIGIGINTNKKNFSKDIQNTATSIQNEFNIKVDREEFITEFCNIFENRLIERIN